MYICITQERKEGTRRGTKKTVQGKGVKDQSMDENEKNMSLRNK